MLFSDYSVVIGKYLPRSLIILRAATEIAKQLVTSHRNVVDSVKRTGVDFVVMVAKECSLSTNNYHDISILASATSCHHSFAKKILQSIESGHVDGLYKRNIKWNAIKASHWTEEICKFVLHETNSRSVPGEEQV